MIRLLRAAWNVVLNDNTSGSQFIASAFVAGESNAHCSRGHCPEGLANRDTTGWARSAVMKSSLNAFQMILMAANVQAYN